MLSLRALQTSTRLLDEPAKWVTSLARTPICAPKASWMALPTPGGLVDLRSMFAKTRYRLAIIICGRPDLVPDGSWARFVAAPRTIARHRTATCHPSSAGGGVDLPSCRWVYLAQSR